MRSARVERAKRPHKLGLNREQVLAAAETIADRDGFASVSLATVSAVFGIKPPSLYNHFAGGLPELKRDLALRGARGLNGALASARSLEDLARAYRAYAGAHPGLYRAMQTPPVADAEWDEALRPLFATLQRAIETSLGCRLEDHALVDAIRALRSALHGFVALENEDGFALGAPRAASFAFLVRVIEAGLSACAGREGGSSIL